MKKIKNIKVALTATKQALIAAKKIVTKVLGLYYYAIAQCAGIIGKVIPPVFLIAGIWFTFKFVINVKIFIIINIIINKM